MSLQNLQSYLFKSQTEEQKNDYIVNDVNWVQINDSNLFSYSTGWVNFNNVSLQGNSVNRLLELSNAYMTIPFGCIVKLSTDTAGQKVSFGAIDGSGNSVFDTGNLFAIAPKAYHQIFNIISNKFGGKIVGQGLEYTNFYLNEKMKNMTADQYRVLGEMMNVDFDSSDSYTLDPSNLVEYNNNTLTRTTYGNTSSNYVNNAQIRRCKRLNHDLLSPSSNFSQSKLFNSSTYVDTYQTGLICVLNQDGDVIQDISAPTNGKTINYMVFQYVASVPLAYLSDFFKNIASVATLSQFELRIQTNLSNNNSWELTYSALTTGAGSLGVTSSVSNQSIGQTCPFMISEAYKNGSGMGLCIYGTTTAVPKLKVVPFIGYYQKSDVDNTIVSNLKLKQPNTFPCQIHIPSVSYTTIYIEQIFEKPLRIQRVLYNDFVVDTTHTGLKGNGSYQKILTFQSSRYRKLYILPFLASTANGCVPYQSLISSAPLTVSACKLINLNIFFGGVNIFNNPQSLNIQHFYNSSLISQAQNNGNAFDSWLQSGQISYTDFQKCYGVYVIDLERVGSEVEDDLVKNIQISFKIDTNSNLTYNMVYILEYQSECFLDRVNGQIVSSAQVNE